MQFKMDVDGSMYHLQVDGAEVPYSFGLASEEVYNLVDVAGKALIDSEATVPLAVNSQSSLYLITSAGLTRTRESHIEYGKTRFKESVRDTLKTAVRDALVLDKDTANQVLRILDIQELAGEFVGFVELFGQDVLEVRVEADDESEAYDKIRDGLTLYISGRVEFDGEAVDVTSYASGEAEESYPDLDSYGVEIRVEED